MKVEIWKPVVGVFGVKYHVSDCGRVKNLKTGLILSPMRTGNKRPGSQRSKVRFSTTPRIDRDVAHLVLEAFVGARPLGAVAMHADDDSSNNRLSNLSWGSLRDNARDCAVKFRGASQKLAVADVKEIFRLRSSGEPGRSVARRFGVSAQRVCDIFKGRTALL